MPEDVPEAALQRVRRMTSMGCLVQPQQVASMIVFLVSPRASYITGQDMAGNGEMYL